MKPEDVVFTADEMRTILDSHRELVKHLLMIIEYYEEKLSDGR